MKLISLAMGFLVLLLLSAAGAEPLRLGDPYRPFAPRHWITHGPSAPLAAPDCITVLEFWATWCPASRALIARQDSMLAAGGEEGVQVIAISSEHPVHLRRFVDRAGWSHVVVRGDPDKQLLQRYMMAATEGDDASRAFPYAFIIGNDEERGRGTILWRGPACDPRAEDPLAAFETALDEIRRGTYDLDRALERARQEERSFALFADLMDALQSDDLDRLGQRLAEIPQIDLPRGLRNELTSTMNTVAWQLITREPLTGAHLARARDACTIALHAGGEDDPYFVDTYARVLYETGNLLGAVEWETRAVDLAPNPPYRAEAVEILQRYRAAADLPPFQEEGEAPTSDPSIWSAAGAPVPDSMMVIVVPSSEEWEKEARSIRDRFYSGAPILHPEDMSRSTSRERGLILYGSPEENGLTYEILAFYDMAIDPHGVRLGDHRVTVEQPVMILSLPNPRCPALPVKILTASRPEDTHRANRFFHSAQALMVGHWEDEHPRVDLFVDLAPFVDIRAGTAPELVMGKETLTREEAQADLEQLHRQLAEHYAGYADIGWELKLRGESWSGRTRVFRDRLSQRETWSWSDLYGLIREYLEPIQDVHFNMAGTASIDGEIHQPRDRFFRALTPYFADARVARTEGRFHLDGYGPLVNPPAVAQTPHAAEPGALYLFPTLPRDPNELGGDATDRYLLGSFAEGAPESLGVTVRIAAAGGERDIHLPAHRGRLAEDPPTGSAWATSGPPETRLPVLAVRTMNASRLRGLPESADSLRDLPFLVLDLRQNPGGSDWAAMQWCQRFSAQGFSMVAYVSKEDGRALSPLHWESHISSPDPRIAGSSAPVAPQPYAGRLLVLIDKQVASSGETFTYLSAQIPGAVILGENSAGCVSYGNVTRHDPLEHSRIKLAYGYSRFVIDWVRPNREGYGFFPDYWLDVADPVSVLADFLGVD